MAQPRDEAYTGLPLLPLAQSDTDYYLLKVAIPRHRGFRSRACIQKWWRFAALTAILGVLVFTGTIVSTTRLTPSLNPASLPHPLATTLTRPLSTVSLPTPLASVVAPEEETSATIARESVDALFARQSITLAQASARYTLQTGRLPPAYYADWFRFAQEKHCLIDEYHRVHRDFKPFYQLAAKNDNLFQDMVDRARKSLEADDGEIVTLSIRKGRVSIASGHTAYAGDIPYMVAQFARWLPDMTFLVNGRDEPRVAFNVRSGVANERAPLVRDPTPFYNSFRPTSEFFARQSRCNIPMEADGFMRSANNFSAFLIETAKPGYTTDLYPMLSMATISPCFADILYPTQYYYDRSRWSAKFAFSDNVPWNDKKSLLYWRGTSTGGIIIGDNYHSFMRFRLMDIVQQHPELMDVRLAAFAEPYCGGLSSGCDREGIIAKYNMTGRGDPREDVYKFIYALDVDGETFSGRFLGLMRSGSLVFKSTFFEEYFNDWLRPFEHYVPVLPDLSDLVQRKRG
ncbi:hypothetical protein C8R45DRAFT_1145778 [Mycena sanguinolenta]|nr:hypothetical protein C8R45DRAFT_1145778 [Mycena sanguinolenta]